MSQRDRPVPPFETLVDDGGCTTAWLADAWTEEEIHDEYSWLFEEPPVRLREVWIRGRWTTPEELGDDDRLYDLFGDWETNGIDTSAVPEYVKPDTPGAHRYWTID